MSIYISAAQILKHALNKKATVKTLVYSSGEKDKRKLFAIVCESLKHRTVLCRVLRESKLLEQTGWSEETCDQVFAAKNVTELDRKYLAITLLYDYLFGKGLGKAGRIRSLITKHKRLVLSTFHNLKLDKSFTDILQVKQNIIHLPRYVRINILRTTTDEIINIFLEEGWILRTDYKPHNFCEIIKCLSEFEFVVDPLIPNVLAFPPRTDFHDHYLYKSGAIILQDRASCFPPFVLNPREGSNVIDSCAAPGNKTTHLAAIMNNTGKLLAFDLSRERVGTLEKFVKKANVTNTTIRCNDFRKVDPSSKSCENVEYILVDPSCSGSGIAERRNDLIDDAQSKTKNRLKKLSNFQSLLLQHALSFPSAKRVVYSTCSIHEAENEKVVDEAYKKFKHKYELEDILPEWEERGKDGYECSKYCVRLNTKYHLTNGFFIVCFVSKLKASQNESSNEDRIKDDKKKKKRKREDNLNETITCNSDSVGLNSSLKEKIGNENQDRIADNLQLKKKVKQGKEKKVYDSTDSSVDAKKSQDRNIEEYVIGEDLERHHKKKITHKKRKILTIKLDIFDTSEKRKHEVLYAWEKQKNKKKTKKIRKE